MPNLNLWIDGRFYKLTDIANVQRGYSDPPTKMFRVNGKPAIGIGINMREGGNNLEFGEGLHEAAKRLTQRVPVGIKLNLVSDQPEVVREAIGEFTKALFEAIVIVLAVSFLSLGFRAGLVVALSIPLVLAIVFIAMEAMGISLQRISLGALIIALGLLVDDAMITIEMMISKIEEGMEKIKAATFAYTSTAFPMLSGTLITILGFLPIGFADNNTGQYTFSLFAVIGVALVASWFVAVIFAPVIGLSLLPSRMKAHAHGPGRFMRAFIGLLGFSMRHRWLTIAASLAAFGASLYGMGFVQQQFFPASNRPELVVTMTLPKNASIAATETETKRLEEWLASDPDIAGFSSYVGGGAIRFYLPLDVQLDNDFMAETVVVAKDLEARDRVLVKLETLFADSFPDVKARISRLELGPPVGWPVQYRVSAPTADEAREYAEQLANVLRSSGLVRNVNYDWAEKSKELRIVVNQDRVRQAGLSSQQVAQALDRVVSGSTVTQLRDSIYLVDVVARAESSERSSVEALRNLQIPTATGASVPLRELAEFQYDLDESYIWRRGRLPTITVQAEPLPGLQPASVHEQLAGAIEALHKSMPAGTLIETGGTVEKSGQSNAALLAQFPLMITLMLTVLIVQLGSFRRMAMVISVAPLGLIGVAIALLTTSTPMGFIAILGIIALAGMIIRNSVILVDQIEHERARGIDPWTGGDRRDHAQVPADHADRGCCDPWHDPHHARRVLGADGLRHCRRARRGHGADPGLPPGPLCRGQSVSGRRTNRRHRPSRMRLRRPCSYLSTEKGIGMPETSSSLLHRYFGSDATMYAGSGETAREYADKMLLSALQEAQSAARSYDTRAQIVGVGYILALNLVLRFGDLLPIHAPIGPLFYAVVWGIVIMPIMQFGHVLYPSRMRAEKEFNGKVSGVSAVAPVYYVEPGSFADVRDLVHQALKSDWTSVLATELLKTSRVRTIKQARFHRGLMMTVLSFIVLGGEQFLRSFTLA